MGMDTLRDKAVSSFYWLLMKLMGRNSSVSLKLPSNIVELISEFEQGGEMSSCLQTYVTTLNPYLLLMQIMDEDLDINFEGMDSQEKLEILIQGLRERNLVVDELFKSSFHLSEFHLLNHLSLIDHFMACFTLKLLPTEYHTIKPKTCCEVFEESEKLLRQFLLSYCEDQTEPTLTQLVADGVSLPRSLLPFVVNQRCNSDNLIDSWQLNNQSTVNVDNNLEVWRYLASSNFTCTALSLSTKNLTSQDPSLWPNIICVLMEVISLTAGFIYDKKAESNEYNFSLCSVSQSSIEKSKHANYDVSQQKENIYDGYSPSPNFEDSLIKDIKRAEKISRCVDRYFPLLDKFSDSPKPELTPSSREFCQPYDITFKFDDIYLDDHPNRRKIPTKSPVNKPLSPNQWVVTEGNFRDSKSTSFVISEPFHSEKIDHLRERTKKRLSTSFSQRISGRKSILMDSTDCNSQITKVDSTGRDGSESGENTVECRPKVVASDCSAVKTKTLVSVDEDIKINQSQPATKFSKHSNKKNVSNALRFHLLFGALHEKSLKECLDVIDKYSGLHVMILLKKQYIFQGLYRFEVSQKQAIKLHGSGPEIVNNDMLETTHRYQCSQKMLELIRQCKTMSIAVDAFTIKNNKK